MLNLFYYCYFTCCILNFIIYLSVYNKVRNKKVVDSIYVRAMIDHNAEKDKEGDLSFRKDDLLHIEDTMYKGQKGVWYAWIISDHGDKIKGGTIPSKDRYALSFSQMC